MLSYILFTFLILLMLTYRWKNMKHIQLYNKLKTNLKCYPVIGHAYLFFGSDEAATTEPFMGESDLHLATFLKYKTVMDKQADETPDDRMNGLQAIGREGIKCGGIGAGWFANRLYSVVSDPEITEVILKNCLAKDFTMKFLGRLLGNGSIIAPVPIWRVRRKILTSSFSAKKLNGFVEIFSCQSNILLNQLNTVGSEPISILEHVLSCIMNVAYECILGIKLDTQNDQHKVVIRAWDDFRDSFTYRACHPWLHPDSVYNLLPVSSRMEEIKGFLEGIADEVVNQKVKEIQDVIEDKNQETQNKTFVEDIIKASFKRGNHNKSALLEETLVLTFASSDSSSVGTSFTCLMLARHPDVQDKVYKEIQQVFGDSMRPMTPADLLKLKYLEAVIKETLRLYPPIPVLIREVLDDVTLPSGITLLKDTSCMVNIWAIHRNPRYWGADAEVFRADRFLDLELKHPVQFMPFSYGPRNCLGPQFAMTLMKTMISTIVRKFKILPAKTTDEPLRIKFDVTMKAVDGFLVRLEPRV